VQVVTLEPAPPQFTPFRGLAWVALMLFWVGAFLDVMVFHGIALSSTHKPGQPVSWISTPYTSLRTIIAGRPVKSTRLWASNWYPKDLAFSKSGWSRSVRAADQAGWRLLNQVIKS
jgi:hypothetical protein